MRLNKKILQALAWLVLIVGLIAAGCAFGQSIELRPASLTAEIPAEGVGRVYNVSVGRENALQDALSGEGEQRYSQSTSMKIDTFSRVTDAYLAERCVENEMAAYMLDEYTEGQSPVPEWWNPNEPMVAEWVATEPHPPVGVDPGGIDYNICSTLYGADGLMMEQWEMGLFARILYREFWGTSRECCIAGADSIVNLWASGYYGNTLFETLSAVTETGGYAFSTFPGVYEVDYDPDGLAEMQAICEERFYGGTEYGVQFFRTDYYHDWCEPCFSIDNVYFSCSPWLK